MRSEQTLELGYSTFRLHAAACNTRIGEVKHPQESAAVGGVRDERRCQ